MKTVYRLLVSSMILVLCLNISMAQDDEPSYPPITPDNAQHLEMIQVLSKGEPRDFVWSPDSTQLAITATGGTWIYDMTSKDIPSYWVKDHNSAPRIAYAPNHDIYVSYESLNDCAFSDCPSNSKAYIRNSQTHEILYEIQRSQSAIAQFSPDGNLLALGTYSGGIRVWETATFLTQTSENPDDFMLCRIGTAASPKKIIFSPDNSWITYEGYGATMMSPEDTSLWFWDTQTCELKLQANVLDSDEFMNSVYTSFIGNSPDGHYLIIPSYTGERPHGLYLWDTTSWENLGQLPLEIERLSFLGFSPNSQQILFTNDEKIKIWDIASNTIIDEIVGNSALYLDTGRLLIDRDNQLYLIENDVEQQLPTNDYGIAWIKISDNQRWLISYHKNAEMFLWDLEDRKLIQLWDIPASDRLIDFSPNNKYLVWNHETTESISILDLEALEEHVLTDFQPTGSNFYWSQSEKILVTYGNFFVDVWSYYETDFEHLWRMPYQSGEFKIITDDFVIFEKKLRGDTTPYFEFFDIEAGSLVNSITLSECDNNSNNQFACDILENSDLHLPQSQVRLSEDEMSLEIIDANGTIIESYPIPVQIRDISDDNSSWQFDENGDLLLASQATLYNLTQNTILAQTSAFPDRGNCNECESRSFQIERTWLSEDLRFLISLQNDNSFSPMSWMTQSAIIVWNIEDNRELYHLVNSVENTFRLTPDMKWLFIFESDSYVGGGSIIFNRIMNVYNGLTGEQLTTLPTFGANASHAQFSPDSRFLIVNSDTLRVWAVVEP